jgi:hypothetical protein
MRREGDRVGRAAIAVRQSKRLTAGCAVGDWLAILQKRGGADRCGPPVGRLLLRISMVQVCSERRRSYPRLARRRSPRR